MNYLTIILLLTICISYTQSVTVYKCTGNYIPDGSQRQGLQCQQKGGQCCDTVTNVNDPNTTTAKDGGAFPPGPNPSRSCPACYSGARVPK